MFKNMAGSTQTVNTFIPYKRKALLVESSSLLPQVKFYTPNSCPPPSVSLEASDSALCKPLNSRSPKVFSPFLVDVSRRC